MNKKTKYLSIIWWDSWTLTYNSKVNTWSCTVLIAAKKTLNFLRVLAFHYYLLLFWSFGSINSYYLVLNFYNLLKYNIFFLYKYHFHNKMVRSLFSVVHRLGKPKQHPNLNLDSINKWVRYGLKLWSPARSRSNKFYSSFSLNSPK